MGYNHLMWEDIPGHSRIKDLLRGYCLSGKIPHALLFAGVAGLGKTAMAREFFKALNCLERSGDACGRCTSCIKADSDSHPDLVSVIPEARWIKVDDIRDILADIGLRPYEARRKCVLIEPAESLNMESANALLKTLEEPPDHTVIMLISHRPKLLLPTVVSRCQLMRFSDEEAQRDLSSYGDGGPCARERVCDALESDGVSSELVGLLTGGDPALLARKYFDQEGWDLLPEVLSKAESVIRDIMVLRQGSDRVLNEELRLMHSRLAGLAEIEEVLDLIRSMRRGVHENINLRVAATELFIRLGQLAIK